MLHLWHTTQDVLNTPVCTVDRPQSWSDPAGVLTFSHEVELEEADPIKNEKLKGSLLICGFNFRSKNELFFLNFVQIGVHPNLLPFLVLNLQNIFCE